ncbi:MAG: DUF4340 domain-containing protein [Sphingobacteriales bacterium]|nr:DUF4340 domain-containing protein [Sphingobacteriales bacterium]
MKLKNSHLLLLLGLLILIVLVIYFAGKKSRQGDLPDKFISFSSEDIQQLEIIPAHQQSEAFKVVKINGRWYVLFKKSKMMADSSFIDRTFAEIDKLIPSRLISESNEDWKTYGVDSSGTLLILTSVKGEKAKIIIGNMTFQDNIYVNTYIRQPEDNRVFAAECYMEGTVRASMDSWREKKMTMPLYSLNFLEIQSDDPAGKVISIKKEGNIWKAGQKDADTSVVNSLIKKLAKINDLPLLKPGLAPGTKAELTLTLDYVQRFKTTLYCYPDRQGFLIGSSVNQGNYVVADSLFYSEFKSLIFNLK